jgi:hypothetical protein
MIRDEFEFNIVSGSTIGTFEEVFLADQSCRFTGIIKESKNSSSHLEGVMGLRVFFKWCLKGNLYENFFPKEEIFETVSNFRQLLAAGLISI